MPFEQEPRLRRVKRSVVSFSLLLCFCENGVGSLCSLQAFYGFDVLPTASIAGLSVQDSFTNYHASVRTGEIRCKDFTAIVNGLAVIAEKVDAGSIGIELDFRLPLAAIGIVDHFG